MKDSSAEKVLLIIIITFTILIGLSYLPWSSLTNDYIKDYNLLEDLLGARESSSKDSSDEEINPEMLAMEAEAANDSVQSAETENVPEPQATAPVQNGVVCIESYSADGNMLPKFRAALGKASSRNVRIAFIGDSFIEGDIICQDLRNKFQDKYGGSGVGYIAAHNENPGFRHTVQQKSSGWKYQIPRQLKANDTTRILAGAYALSDGAASSTFNGVSKRANTAAWQRSRFFFISPDSGTITLTVDGRQQSVDVQASPNVQSFELAGNTSKLEIKSSIKKLVGLGVYLDSPTGVHVDCMPLRGESGRHLGTINANIARQMAKDVDYSLIIVEYGVNAVSPKQNDYTAYGKSLTKAINHLKEVYPNADIILMGVPDRGFKKGAEVSSLQQCNGMITAQRKAAADARIHFWDSKAAMGGESAVIDWRKRNLVNADYIHLNHKGGGEMATLMFNAFQQALGE